MNGQEGVYQQSKSIAKIRIRQVSCSSYDGNVPRGMQLQDVGEPCTVLCQVSAEYILPYLGLEVRALETQLTTDTIHL